MGSTEDFERRMRREFYEPRWTGGLVVSTCIFMGATWHMLARERGFHELVLSILVLWSIYLGSILLHELGHALVARAVNLRPIVLLAGTGPRLRLRVGGLALNLGMVPASGLVQVVSETQQPRLKWRLMAVYAAGPAVSLALWVLATLRAKPPLIAQTTSGRRTMAVIANNYAWACYMLDDATRLDEADKASAEADQQLPNAAYAIGTRGAVLVARGHLDEGKRLLRRALKLHRTSARKAPNLVGLALVAVEQGKRKKARELLASAEKLDPDCELLSRGRLALAAAERRRNKMSVSE